MNWWQKLIWISIDVIMIAVPIGWVIYQFGKLWWEEKKYQIERDAFKRYEDMRNNMRENIRIMSEKKK